MVNPRYLTHGQYVAWHMARSIVRVAIVAALLIGCILLGMACAGCDSRDEARTPTSTTKQPTAPTAPTCGTCGQVHGHY